MNQQMLLVYGTTSGFSEGVPQLGDGPYTFDPSNGFNEVVANFSASLMKGREKVYEIFGNFRNGTFLPGYFYPKNVPKPYGYAITQTAYIWSDLKLHPWQCELSLTCTARTAWLAWNIVKVYLYNYQMCASLRCTWRILKAYPAAQKRVLWWIFVCIWPRCFRGEIRPKF